MKCTDTVENRVFFDSDEHWQWHELCAEVDSHLSKTEAIASWKEAAVVWNRRCKLGGFEKESGSSWEISVYRSSVKCALKSAGGQLSHTASIDLSTYIWPVAARWLPCHGEDDRRRAVVACALGESMVPAILHFFTPSV